MISIANGITYIVPQTPEMSRGIHHPGDDTEKRRQPLREPAAHFRDCELYYRPKSRDSCSVCSWRGLKDWYTRKQVP